MKTGSGTDTNGRGRVAVGNTMNGIDSVGDISVFWNAAGADGDTTNGGVGKASGSPELMVISLSNQKSKLIRDS